ncbi:MAG: Gfo/Idh/MocA family protein [Candidatus Kariarchaeaceae archaeon]|jgi:predicted dehydrogenase
MKKSKLNAAIVGCGFVSDKYMQTIDDYSNFALKGVTEKILERGEKFSKFYNVPFIASLEELVGDDDLDIIINLTDPDSHYEVLKTSLINGKHVYSEKPLCTSFSKAKELTKIAKHNNLKLITAPCNLLGASAQTLWKAVRENMIGRIPLVYAEMDDGPVHLMNPDKWKSKLGVPWPYENEFSMGSALEHLGYVLTWLVAIWGPVVKMTAFSHCLTPQKLPSIKETNAPDFSVACLEHETGVITRITCGIMAPMNRGIHIIGDKGILNVEDCWDNHSPVKVSYYSSFRFKAERKEYVKKYPLLRRFFGLNPKKIPLVTNSKKKSMGKKENMKMDYCLGINDLAYAVLNDKEPLLNSSFCLHINELTLKIHHSLSSGKDLDIETTFDHNSLIELNSEM